MGPIFGLKRPVFNGLRVNFGFSYQAENSRKIKKNNEKSQNQILESKDLNVIPWALPDHPCLWATCLVVGNNSNVSEVPSILCLFYFVWKQGYTERKIGSKFSQGSSICAKNVVRRINRPQGPGDPKKFWKRSILGWGLTILVKVGPIKSKKVDFFQNRFLAPKTPQNTQFWGLNRIYRRKLGRRVVF